MDPGEHRGTLTGVLLEFEQSRVLVAQHGTDRIVARSVVDEDEFVVDARERFVDLLLEESDVLLLVVERDDDGEFWSW